MWSISSIFNDNFCEIEGKSKSKKKTKNGNKKKAIKKNIKKEDINQDLELADGVANLSVNSE